MRTHVEIVTFFTNNDPVKVFAEMAEQNPANKTPEIQEEIKAGKKELMITVSNLTEYFAQKMKEPIPQPVVEKIYSSIVGNTKRSMSEDEFTNLFAKMHYRVIKDTIMTDIFELAGAFKRVVKLQVGEIVRLVDDFKTTNNGMTRFLAETVSAAETVDDPANAPEEKRGY